MNRADVFIKNKTNWLTVHSDTEGSAGYVTTASLHAFHSVKIKVYNSDGKPAADSDVINQFTYVLWAHVTIIANSAHHLIKDTYSVHRPIPTTLKHHNVTRRFSMSPIIYIIHLAIEVQGPLLIWYTIAPSYNFWPQQFQARNPSLVLLERLVTRHPNANCFQILTLVKSILVH